MSISEKCVNCPRVFSLHALEDAERMYGGPTRRLKASLGGITLEAAELCEGPFERYTPYTLIDSDGTITTYPEENWLERVCAVEIGLLPVMHSGIVIETALLSDNPAT
ncbi:MAG: hypothetical protein ABIP74_01955 [Candidatus Saccharimonas sp.]